MNSRPVPVRIEIRTVGGICEELLWSIHDHGLMDFDDIDAEDIQFDDESGEDYLEITTAISEAETSGLQHMAKTLSRRFSAENDSNCIVTIAVLPAAS